MQEGKFYKYKLKEYQFNHEMQKCIKDTCKYCIENTFGADEEKREQPIMMLGKIQSGKTRAFTGLIALAFDNSFDMIFILTKNSTALVEQTVKRMNKEFKEFVNSHEVYVSDIMGMKSEISGYRLGKKNIIIAKKQQTNLSKIINFIEGYSISANKKCLIIDDEADTTGIGYEKIKGKDEFDLRTVADKVNNMRGTLDGCVFVQVTATPYALYLQPDFIVEELEPIKPHKTILVPSGKGYIGGEYYFMKSREEDHPAQYLFEPMSEEELAIVSVARRNGKKSKIDDRRVIKEEEILIKEDKLPIFKRGIVNFIIGAVVLRKLTNSNNHYSYIIHTATQKNSHTKLKAFASIFLEQVKDRTDLTQSIIEKLVIASYEDIRQSVLSYNLAMPEFDYIKSKFFDIIDKSYYSIDVVNSDNDVKALLNNETGELNLETPFSIFVGGQTLDRGVTIPNMIGFYYGRNPQTMQQDTVMQHSRMFGYREELLPVTRFYTSHLIYNSMVKITEIDISLREDIKSGKQGEGVYFITKSNQQAFAGKKNIKPCSPAKIRVSNIIMLKAHMRVLPVGFSPAVKSSYVKASNGINKLIKSKGISIFGNCKFKVDLKVAEELLKLVYSTIIDDKTSSRFISVDEMRMTLRYLSVMDSPITIFIKRNRDIEKYRITGMLQDAPDTSKTDTKEAREAAVSNPSIILLQQNGNSEEWKHRSFWWPVIIAPQNTPKTIFASKVVGENINKQHD